MTVTAASFRADFPEFMNESQFPIPVINYWLAIAKLILGIGGGSPPIVCSFTGSILNNVMSVTAIGYGSVSLLPLLLQGNNVPANAAITGQLTGAPAGIGTYSVSFTAEEPIAAEAMVAIQSGYGSGGSPFWGPSSLTANSPPTTIADFATEMWVAHQIVLEKQAIGQAATGGNPGTAVGLITNKSVNGVSVGFDVSVIASGNMQENAGYYNSTIYGMRFYRLMKMRGAGPIQLGIGRAPPFLFFNSWGILGSSNAWAGPYPGIQQGDSGFSA
jgi:hypothetical protein